MEYTIEPAADGNYLIVKVFGKITVPFALQFVDEAHRKAAEQGLNKLFYDVTDAQNVDSAVENFSMIHDELPRLKVRRNMQIVLLTATGDHSHDFIETASRNAGFNVTICRDRITALNKLGIVLPESTQP